LLTFPSLGGDAPSGWKTPYVLVLLILGALLIVAFVIWETKYSYAMIDMSIWKDRDFTLVSDTLLFKKFLSTNHRVATYYNVLRFHRFPNRKLLACIVFPKSTRHLLPHDRREDVTYGCLRLDS